MSRRFAILLATLTVLASCDEMVLQRKQDTYGPYAPAPNPADVVAFDEAAAPPPPVSAALLARGQERYRIYCTPCHSELGDGRGMIVQRGFPAPPSFHTAADRGRPPQFFYDAITRGYGTMYPFAPSIRPADRWAIVAYIRALQLSQNATLADLAPAERSALQ